MLWETLHPLPGYLWSVSREELQKICLAFRFCGNLNGGLESILLHILYKSSSICERRGSTLFLTPYCQTSWLVALCHTTYIFCEERTLRHNFGVIFLNIILVLFLLVSNLTGAILVIRKKYV